MASSWEANAGPIKLDLSTAAKVEAALKVAPAAMKRELRAAHRRTAKEVRAWTRAAAMDGTRQQRHMAGGIGSSANSTQARLTLQNTARAPGALGTFFGSKRFPQFPTWVGKDWPPADPNRGPYVINPTLHRKQGEIEDVFIQGQLHALARAFPYL